MKRVSSAIFALGLSLLCGICLGQDAVAALDPTAERELISVQRGEQESLFRQRQQVCYQRFAVNDCLIQARRERRGVLDELRRREVLLNELERQNQAINELNRIHANLSPERQRELFEQAEQARQEALARQVRNDEKNAARLNAPAESSRQSMHDQASNTASQAAQNERAYLDKLAQAQQRKADLEKRFRQQGKPASGLPVLN
jgi:hypothetical protein